MKERFNTYETKPMKVLVCSDHGMVWYKGVDFKPKLAIGRGTMDYLKARHLQDYPGCKGTFSTARVPQK